MIEIILIAYAATVFIFFSQLLKDVPKQSFWTIIIFFVLSIIWPIVLIGYTLDGEKE